MNKANWVDKLHGLRYGKIKDKKLFKYVSNLRNQFKILNKIMKPEYLIKLLVITYHN